MHTFNPILLLIFIKKPPNITHPPLIHILIIPKPISIHHIFTLIHKNITSSKTTTTHTINKLQKPNTPFKTKITTNQYTHQTNINNTNNIKIIQLFTKKHNNFKTLTPINNLQLSHLTHFITKTNTTHTNNTPLHIQHNIQTNNNHFKFITFLNKKTQKHKKIIKIIILQYTFTHLITNQTIHKIIQ